MKTPYMAANRVEWRVELTKLKVNNLNKKDEDHDGPVSLCLMQQLSIDPTLALNFHIYQSPEISPISF